MTDYERRAKVNSTLNRHKISFKKIRDALVLSCNRRTAIQNVIGLFHLISAPPPPRVEEQWNSSGVRDKSGGICQGQRPEAEEFLRGKTHIISGNLQG